MALATNLNLWLPRIGFPGPQDREIRLSLALRLAIIAIYCEIFSIFVVQKLFKN